MIKFGRSMAVILLLSAALILSNTGQVEALGETEVDIKSYFSRIMDSTPTQLINEAQIWHGEEELSDTEYADYPVLSAAAPFKAGRLGRNDFTMIPAGNLSQEELEEIYIYEDNLIRGLLLNGEEIRDWLEHVGEHFNRIDPESSEDQYIVDDDKPPYNHDIIEGIEYEYDIRQPAGERLNYLLFQEEEIDADDEFIVMTNDHRVDGDFPHMEEENVVYSPDLTNLEVMKNYIQKFSPVTPDPTVNWGLQGFEAEGDLLYESNPDGEEYVRAMGIPGIEMLETTRRGYGVFSIDLKSLAEQHEK